MRQRSKVGYCVDLNTLNYEKFMVKVIKEAFACDQIWTVIKEAFACDQIWTKTILEIFINVL